MHDPHEDGPPCSPVDLLREPPDTEPAPPPDSAPPGQTAVIEQVLSELLQAAMAVPGLLDARLAAQSSRLEKSITAAARWLDEQHKHDLADLDRRLDDRLTEIAGKVAGLAMVHHAHTHSIHHAHRRLDELDADRETQHAANGNGAGE